MNWRIKMNKYQKKILEIAPAGAEVYELVNKKIRSTETQVLDFLMDYAISFYDAISNLRKRVHYYLVIHENNTELVEISKDLSVSTYTIPKEVFHQKRKHFDFNGQRFTLHRKMTE